MVSDAVQHLNMMIEVMTVVISAIAEEQGSDVVKKKVRLSRPSPFCTFFFRGGWRPGGRLRAPYLFRLALHKTQLLIFSLEKRTRRSTSSSCPTR